MRKIVTLRKLKKSETKFLKAHVPFASKELKDPHVVVEILMDCVKSGDLETFREVLIAHLMTVNKFALAKKAGIALGTK